MTVAAALLTADQYRLLPDDGRSTELVRGRVVEMPPTTPRHGEVCCQAAYLLRRHLEGDPRGRVVTNDSGVVTERDPDTVRGADVAYYSYSRVPRGPLPQGYLSVPPELVFEVLSPRDRWRDVLAKVTEYLDAGVSVVCVLDPAHETAYVYTDAPPRQLNAADEFSLPDLLGEFRVPVRRFFE